MRYFHLSFLYSVFEVSCILYMNTSQFELAVFHVLQSLAGTATAVDPIDQIIISVVIAHVKWQGTWTRNRGKRWLKGAKESQGNQLGSCFCPLGGGQRGWRRGGAQKMELTRFW